MPACFVTGTDTDAGKTLVTSGLLALARRRGLTTLGLKPVASGSATTPGGLRNADALALQAQSHPPVPYATVNPYAFAPAIAPHLAARRDGVTLTLVALDERVRAGLALGRDLTLVEGAGGWRVPLNDDEDLAGLAGRLGLPVILVVGLRLGCISHARLTHDAIAANGLRLAGWAGSLVDPAFAADDALYRDNLATLAHTLPAPCLGVVPRLTGEGQAALAEAAADHLELPPGLSHIATSLGADPVTSLRGGAVNTSLYATDAIPGVGPPLRLAPGAPRYGQRRVSWELPDAD